MSEMVEREGSSSITISEGDIPIAAYQAIYHKMTRRTEKLVRKFDDPFIITRENIVDLDERIRQSIRQY